MLLRLILKPALSLILLISTSCPVSKEKRALFEDSFRRDPATTVALC
jgi:hypothetical protein